MKLDAIRIENFRAVQGLSLPFNPSLTVLHGNNAQGKTSVLTAIAVGLGIIPTLLPGGGGLNFKKSDVRNGSELARIIVHTTKGLSWERRAYLLGRAFAQGSGGQTALSSKPLREYIGGLIEAEKEGEKATLPVIAFYDTDRAVFELPQRRRNFGTEFNRFRAFQDALAAKPSFKALFEWFHAKENEELRQQRTTGSFSVKLADLEAVRRAICKMMPDLSDPHVEVRPLRFIVTMNSRGGGSEKLSLDQLSGGYRIMLALAADLARRMAQANPHLPDPLESEAIVIIDEVELHLHPEWQQRVLNDLSRTFPNAQFIVSTHSPQVLTTVRPEQILHLRFDEQGVHAEQAEAPTYGAEAGDVLSAVMGVQERPPRNEFATALENYRRLVSSDQGEGAEAARLRDHLKMLSPNDPALGAADVEIRRRKLLKSLPKRP